MQDIIATRVVWESEPIAITADEVVSTQSEQNDQKTAKAEAVEFLSKELADGPLSANDVRARARAAGIPAKRACARQSASSASNPRRPATDGSGHSAKASQEVQGVPL